jgi:hypothetical protein
MKHRRKVLVSVFIGTLTFFFAWTFVIQPGEKNYREQVRWGRQLASALSSESRNEAEIDQLLSHRGTVRVRYFARRESAGSASDANLLRTNGKALETRCQFTFRVVRKNISYWEWYLVVDGSVQDFSFGRL